MKREKLAIEIGQIWRDKRRPERVIRVTNLFVGKAPGGVSLRSESSTSTPADRPARMRGPWLNRAFVVTTNW